MGFANSREDLLLSTTTSKSIEDANYFKRHEVKPQIVEGHEGFPASGDGHLAHRTGLPATSPGDQGGPLGPAVHRIQRRCIPNLRGVHRLPEAQRLPAQEAGGGGQQRPGGAVLPQGAPQGQERQGVQGVHPGVSVREVPVPPRNPRQVSQLIRIIHSSVLQSLHPQLAQVSEQLLVGVAVRQGLVHLAEDARVLREAVLDGGGSGSTLLVAVDRPFLFEGVPKSSPPAHLLQALLVGDHVVQDVDEPQRQQPEPRHREASQDPPNPQMVMGVPNQRIVQPVLAGDSKTRLLDIHLNPDKVHVLLEAPDQPFPDFLVLPENFGLLVAECMARIIKPRTVVVREQPLNIVVGVLHPVEVLPQFRLDLPQQEVPERDFHLIAVEKDIMQVAFLGDFENVNSFEGGLAVLEGDRTQESLGDLLHLLNRFAAGARSRLGLRPIPLSGVHNLYGWLIFWRTIGLVVTLRVRLLELLVLVMCQFS